MKARRIVAYILSLLLAVSLSVPAFGNDVTARNISIFEVDGDNARLSRGAAREVVPRAGQRLSDGNILTTGRNTNIFLRLDNDSILKMDQLSRITVSSSSRNRISLTVQSGNALVYAGTQTNGQTLETRIGNTSLTVRGTMYVIGRDMSGALNIAMLSGSGDVNGTELPAGTVMLVCAQRNEQQVHALNLDDLNAFTLSSILNNSTYLLNHGDFLTQDLVEQLPQLISQRSADEQAALEEATALPEIEPIKLYPETHTPLIPPVSDILSDFDDIDVEGWNLADILQLPPHLLPDRESDYSDYFIPGRPPIEPPIENPDEPSGDGTLWNPHLIETFEHLLWMTDHEYPTRLSLNYRLVANITTSPGFMIDEPFSGRFDGNAHTITVGASVLSVESGLFRTVASSGVVSNLSVDGLVMGANNIAGIARINYGIIENSNFTGTMLGNNTIGGIAGTNYGTIRYSFSNSAIIGNIRVGSIAGVNNGTIESSYSAGRIRSTDSHIGGIAGENNHLIQNVYSISTIEADSAYHVGGVAGRNNGIVNNAFSAGSVSGRSHVGGLTGLNSGTLSNSVSINTSISSTGISNAVTTGIPATNSFFYESVSLITRMSSDMVTDDSYASMPIYLHQPVLRSDLQTSAWWQGMLGWSPVVWNLASPPTLRGVGGIQNPQLPPPSSYSIHLSIPVIIEDIPYPPKYPEDETDLEDDDDDTYADEYEYDYTPENGGYYTDDYTDS